jgi:hypothetical protein
MAVHLHARGGRAADVVAHERDRGDRAAAALLSAAVTIA